MGHGRSDRPAVHGVHGMSPRFAWAVLLSVTACSGRPDPPAPPRTPSVAPPTAATRAQPPSRSLPPEACSRDGYEAFVEAFVRNPGARPSLALAGAPVEKLDIAMRDYSWVLASQPDTLLDVHEQRSGDVVSVTAQPVERNDEDEVVKTLGPLRTYTFRYIDNCWKFTGSN